MTRPRPSPGTHRKPTPRSGLDRRDRIPLLGLARDWLESFGVVAVNFGLLALLLGLFAIVTGRVLGPADRGVVVLFMTLSSMLMVAGSFGTNTYARVHLVRRSGGLELRDYIGLVHVLAVVQLVLAAGIGALVLHLAHSLTGPLIVILLAIYSMLNVASYLLRDGMYACGHSTRASLADPVAAAAQLLLVVVLWGSGHMTLRYTLAAITVGQTAEIVYLAGCYRRGRLGLRARYRAATIRRQIAGGLPALISNFGQTILFRLDRILLGMFATTAVVGIYSVAATTAEILILIPTAVSQVIFHQVASGRKRIRDLTVLRLANVGLAMALAVVLIVVAPFLVDLLFGHAYVAAVKPLRILAIGVIGMGAYLVDSACLNAVGRLRTASLITTFGALAVTLLDVGLIPAYAAAGAAVASAVAYFATAAYAALRLRQASRQAAVDHDVPPGPASDSRPLPGGTEVVGPGG